MLLVEKNRGDFMDFPEYQGWISAFYKKRGWYQLAPFIRMNFLSEETGEVARAVRSLEIGRDRPDEEAQTYQAGIANLTEELGDVLDNVFILADKYEIQLEDILRAHKQKLSQRFQNEN